VPCSAVQPTAKVSFDTGGTEGMRLVQVCQCLGVCGGVDRAGSADSEQQTMAKAEGKVMAPLYTPCSGMLQAVLSSSVQAKAAQSNTQFKQRSSCASSASFLIHFSCLIK
jgi:hypothetical protein